MATRIKKQVKCRSGITGWQNWLRKEYSTLGEWQHQSELYGLHIRLGFHSAQEAWDANPIIQGSVIPTDYCTVPQTYWAVLESPRGKELEISIPAEYELAARTVLKNEYPHHTLISIERL